MHNALTRAASTAFALGLMSATAMAQLPAEAPKTSGPGLTVPNARGDALFDRPKGNTLAPVDAPPIPTAASDMPTSKLKVPAGFKVEPYATGIPDARSMAVTPSGMVFVGNRLLDKVYAIVPSKDGGQPTVKVIASKLYRPNGVAFHDGALYVAELNRITRYDNIEANVDHPPQPVMIYDNLPSDEAHGWKFIGIGPDNKLYIPIGAPGNILIPASTNAQIRRIDLDGKNMEMVATGVRNSVGFDWNPATKDLYFTNNGRDWVSEDLPNDTLHMVPAAMKSVPNFGFPYCHQGNFTDPEFGWGKNCDDYAKPAALLGPHVASLGMRFYKGDQFGPGYKNAIFAALHGSWDRTVKLGGTVDVIKLNEDGSVQSQTPFLTGFLQNNNYVGRPVDVQPMPDGSMLVSDDWNGAVWRVSKTN